MKILVNKNKMTNIIRKGVSLALTIATIGSFTACSNTTEDTNVINQTPTTTQTTLEDTDTLVYDFEFLENKSESQEITEVYDWSETEQLIKNTNKEAGSLIFTSQDITTAISPNKYAGLVCENKDEYGSTYYRIVDNKGNYIGGIYNGFEKIDDNTLLFRKEELESRENIKDTLTYTILNQITGELKEIKAYSLSAHDGFISKRTYKETENGVGCIEYELLNADGTLATDTIYTNLAYDYNTKKIYLSKEGQTEILDTNTKQARKIDGVVEYAYNNFLIISSNNENSENNTGVFYLEDINSELKEMIPYSYSYLSFVLHDEENPLFEAATSESDKCYLITKTGEKLIDKTHDFYISSYDDTNLIRAYNGVALDDETIYLLDVYDKEGQVIASDIHYNVYTVIPNTDMAIFQPTEDGKYGVMRHDGTYQIMPEYDDLYLFPIYQQTEDGSSEIATCYLIGRKETEQQTTILNASTLEEVEKGDYSCIEAEDIASEKYLEQISAIQLTK